MFSFPREHGKSLSIPSPRPDGAAAKLLLSLSFVLLGQGVGLVRADPKGEAAASRCAQQLGSATGKLVIAGGGKVEAILDYFVELAGGKDAHIVVIPTASGKAEQVKDLPTVKYWQERGVRLTLLHTRDRGRANDPKFVEPLRRATGVWLTGGDQSLLVAAYKGTAVERALHRLLAEGKVIGGTSAGAAVMSSVMIVGGNPLARIGTGFGFVPGVVVDQHFENRKRLQRLLGVLGQYPECLGLGIDEQTAVVVEGASVKVVGEANVRLCWHQDGAGGECVQVLRPGDAVDLTAAARRVLGRNAVAARRPVGQTAGTPMTADRGGAADE